MTMAQLVFQNSQQVGNDVQALVQQSHALVHLEIAPHGLVDGLELRLYPEQLGGVEHGPVEVDGDAEDEEVADLHVDLLAGEVDFAGEGNVRGYVFACLDSGGNELLVEGCLHVFRISMSA